MIISGHFGTENNAWKVGIVQIPCEYCLFYLCELLAKTVTIPPDQNLFIPLDQNCSILLVSNVCNGNIGTVCKGNYAWNLFIFKTISQYCLFFLDEFLAPKYRQCIYYYSDFEFLNAILFSLNVPVSSLHIIFSTAMAWRYQWNFLLLLSIPFLQYFSFFLSFIYHFTFNVAIRSLWINTIRVLLFYNDEIYHFFKIIWFSLSADLFWSVAKWPDDFPCAKKMYLKEMYEENVFWNCLFGMYLQYNPHCDFLIRLNTFLSNFVRVFYQNLHSCLALLVLGIICFYIFESVAPVFRWSYLCFGFYSGLFWVWWIAVTLIFLLLFSLILSLIPFTIFHCFNDIVVIFSGCICRIANLPLL